MSEANTAAPYERCGARTRSGETCKQVAGARTDHSGTGRCWLHGGATPIKSGRYSKITRPRIADLVKEFEGDPDPLNLLPEVQLLRALIVDYVERYDEYTEALLAWHASFLTEEDEDGKQRPVSAKPKQVMDILSAAKFIQAIGQLTERMEKSRKEGTITLDTLDRVIEQHGVELVKAAQEALPDEAERQTLLDAVERRWNDIRVDVASTSRAS